MRVNYRPIPRDPFWNAADAAATQQSSEGPTAKSCWPDAKNIPDISEHQRSEYKKASNNGGSIIAITGKPGCGKSFVCARILRTIPQARVAVCGPTGKSAVRITELMNKAGVGLRATTIHSLLKVMSADDGWQFEYNEGNPLPFDWIFCDESSMIDVSIMGSLLAARAPGCKVCFIGDCHQLAPVGHGAPLRDLLKAGIPQCELTEPQRNAGRIVLACHGIVDRKVYEPSIKLDLEAENPENLIHVERADPEQQIATLKAMLEKFRNGAKIGGETVCPIWSVQVIVPVNDKSPLARKKINGLLQSFLNPTGEQIDSSPFRVGDKIVNGKNEYLPTETNIPASLIGGPWNVEQRDKRCFCANGEFGKVLAVFPKYTVVQLWAPGRVLRIPHGKQWKDENGEEGGSGSNWDFGYASSCHKFQGSEAPVVIVLADAYPGARMLTDSCWWYTALSRAKTLCMTIGEREIIQGAIQKSHIWKRKTMLVESIRDLQQSSLSNTWDQALSLDLD